LNPLYRHVVFVTALALCLSCSSGGEGTPDRDGGSSGSGGTGSSTGGTGGTGGTSAGGAAGEGVPDAGATLELPASCAPSDMRFVCNPMTNEGCDDSAGEACDYGLDDYFTCYPAPNDVAEGGACDWEQGPYCEPLLTCDFSDPETPTGVCRRHCCADTDCKSPQKCEVFNPEFGTLGVCR
jgi:hypothetical protein